MNTSQQATERVERTDETTLFDRPTLSVVHTVRAEGPCYLLRVRTGASRSLVAATTVALTGAGPERGRRVLGDVIEIEFSAPEPAWPIAA